MPKVDEGGEDQSQIAFDELAIRVNHFVPLLFEYRCHICGMDTRHILKEFPDALDPARGERPPAKSETKPPNHRIFIYKSVSAL
jgi:hypothetical protein